MNNAVLKRRKRLNTLQSVLLVAAMAALLSAVGYTIAGAPYALIALLGSVLVYRLNPSLSPRLVLHLYRGRELHYHQAAPLYDILRLLAERAGLPAIPLLYYLPTPVMNAFAFGHPGNAVIAISDGLLRRLHMRELAAVLAHEVSHIAHDDLRTWASRT